MRCMHARALRNEERRRARYSYNEYLCRMEKPNQKGFLLAGVDYPGKVSRARFSGVGVMTNSEVAILWVSGPGGTSAP